MSKRNLFRMAVITLFILLLFGFTLNGMAQAQDYWTALPPYNTLWPLWSPALSPVDAATGLPVPVVSSLEPSTVLPVQPGLTWNPAMEYPWLLYNTPGGLAYFDMLYGINFWPPSGLVDSTGVALPIGLPTDYALLPPTESSWLQQNVLYANNYFVQAYPSLLAIADPALLAAAATVPLAPPTLAALNAGLLPLASLSAIFPAPGILDFLTPAALLGL